MIIPLPPTGPRARTCRYGGLLLGAAVMLGLGSLVRPAGSTPVLVALRRHQAAADLDRLATPGAFRVTGSGVLYLQLPGTRDPWGSPYQIRGVDGCRIRVLSLGPDRCEGTPDDIRREVDLGR